MSQSICWNFKTELESDPFSPPWLLPAWAKPHRGITGSLESSPYKCHLIVHCPFPQDSFSRQQLSCHYFKVGDGVRSDFKGKPTFVEQLTKPSCAACHVSLTPQTLLPAIFVSLSNLDRQAKHALGGLFSLPVSPHACCMCLSNDKLIFLKIYLCFII